MSLFNVADFHTGSRRLNDIFGVAPFSVLDASTAAWQERKRAWLALGIESELGRDARSYNLNEWMAANGVSGDVSDVSIFDPVLCELAYRWFSPSGAAVLDPFAGGSVRGVVASLTGRDYFGVELRAEQVEANRDQADRLCVGEQQPQWVQGDSAEVLGKWNNERRFDFIFSCPPYFDLEVYSDDPADISAMAWPDFERAYRKIIERAMALLREDRFAVFVVGDVRDKSGHLRNLEGLTVDAFAEAGGEFYNDITLATAPATTGLRVASSVSGFNATRKVGRRHQYALVFLKGDAKRAVEACGEIDFGALS